MSHWTQRASRVPAEPREQFRLHGHVTGPLWRPLVDIHPGMGLLRFASGSQRDGYLGHYVADGARVTPPVNDNQARDITRWMPGLQPGDLVASELNPLLHCDSDHPLEISRA
ncbi:MAG: hypothetical protein KDI09_10530 [Halioglobus sp.]|nr:hypothetical protein [Halioglobus sp.]